MNYDELLKSKIFNFSKQLLCNLIYSICIVCVVALLVVHFFNCAIYDVFSNSQYPFIKEGDLIVVKSVQNYVAGDIVKFNDAQTGLPIVHRVISIKESENKVYYICHGDNVQSVINFVLKDDNVPYMVEWKTDSEFVENLSLNELKDIHVVQVVESKNVEGKVVAKLSMAGYVSRFIKKNYLQLVLIVLIVWKLYEFLFAISANKKHIIKL